MNRPQPPFPPLLAVLGLLLATWFGLTQTASAVFLPPNHSDLFAATLSPAEHQENSSLLPENRVWENFGNPNEITPADELNSLQLRWESHFGELENASGVLSYADGNPISLSDPFGLDATTAVQLGQEWLTGSGPRSHNFVDGDGFTEQLRTHSNLQQGFQTASQEAAASANGQPSKLMFSQDYSLSGVQGVPKYLNDYSTLATGGMTGNLAVTYLGSYRADVSVSNINAQAGTANAQVIITNSSTIASGTRPPVLGYTDWWQNNVAPTVNSFFSSGPLSPTKQTITMNQTVNFPPVQQRKSNK